jgi:hypothetical protein
MFSAFGSVVMQSRTTTIIHGLQNISLYFVLQEVFFFGLPLISFFISFFLHCVPYSTPAFQNVPVILSIFLQRLYRTKSATGSWSVNAQHTFAVAPYQALERRLAQEALIGCAGLRNKKI